MEKESGSKQGEAGDKQSLPLDDTAMADVAARAAAAEARAAAAENRVSAIEQQQRQKESESKQPPQDPVYTEQQIQEAIDMGQITAAQGATLIAKQLMKQAVPEIEGSIRTRLEAEQRAERITEQKDSYYELRPALNDAKSADFKAAQAEYMHLTKKLGMPESEATEIAAFRNVFGSIDSLRAAKPRERETFGETGAGSFSPDQGSEEGIPEPLRKNPMLRRHYERAIEKRMYTGFDDPKLLAEMQYVRSSQ